MNKICLALLSALLVTILSSAKTLYAKNFSLNDAGDVVSVSGSVLGESTATETPTNTVVLSADKYELQNEGGQIKISTFQVKEASSAAQKFEFSKNGDKFEISTEGEGFSLTDNGDIHVKTDLPLAVKRSNKSLWLVTPTGEKEIKMPPSRALEKLVKDNVLTRVELSKKEIAFLEGTQSVGLKNSSFEIKDSPSGAFYQITGEKETRLFNLLPLSFKVAVRMDVTDGRIIEVKQPWFLASLGFLFSNN